MDLSLHIGVDVGTAATCLHQVERFRTASGCTELVVPSFASSPSVPDLIGAKNPLLVFTDDENDIAIVLAITAEE